MRETRVQSLGQEDPLEKEMVTHSVFLPGESHGRRSLAGYSPWGRKESDMTEWLHFTTTKTVISFYCLKNFPITLCSQVTIHGGFPDGVSGKELACQYRRHGRWGFDPWVRKSAHTHTHHTPYTTYHTPHHIPHTTHHTHTPSTTVHRQSLICFLMCFCMHLVAQSCPTLFDTPDCSLPGSSVHRIS